MIISRIFESGTIEIVSIPSEWRSSTPRIHLTQTILEDRPYLYSPHYGRVCLSPGWIIT